MNKKETKKRRLEGIITSDKMTKTAVVAVSLVKLHKKYKKRYVVTNKFKAHNENNEYKVGDKVVIEETRPMSKEKRWIITGLVENK